MCATALPPGKHGQVGGATAGRQEPGDEWEPGPAPSGSRENAALPNLGLISPPRPVSREEKHLVASGRRDPFG